MRNFYFVILLLLSFSSYAQNSNLKEQIQKKFEKNIKKFGLATKDLGLYAKTDEALYALNENNKMIPASITKLVTAAAALDQYPPGAKFKTQLMSTSPLEAGVLKGNLYLRGGGDPSFVSENMWFLVNVFIRSGVKKIEGDIVVDDSLFDRQRFDLSRQKERVDRAYDAPIGAMSFNWNSVNIFVRPGKKSGEPAKVFLDPENSYTRLTNTVKTSSKKTEVFADRDEDSKGIGDVLKVSGSIGEDNGEVTIFKNITQPDLWSGYNLKSFLQQRGVEVTGGVKSASTPSGARIMAENESKPIEAILTDMNKFSNNYVAEMITKQLSLPETKPGSIEGGMKKIRSYMKKIGVKESEYSLLNPSGLTRENRLTALALWQVLSDMKKQFQYEPEFITSLPIAGVDGTLKKRMKGSPAERWVRAKTGFLTNVVSLAGYAGRRDGNVVPFVFIYNGSADESKVRAFFDELAETLTE